MWFFTKKQFLCDFIAGIVDIHNHVLPGIDDGAPTIATSLAMLQAYQDMGITSCIATPHIMADYYGNSTVTITTTLQTTRAALSQTTFANFITNAAAEYMLDDQFSNLLDAEDLLFLKERVLLTELSYFQKPNNLLELCFDMVTRNITPILAHPERYRYFNDLSTFQDLKERGFLLQLNMLSLSGHYGADIKKMGEQLLLAGMYDFIATDAHKPEHLEKIKNLQVSKKHIDSLRVLCEKQRQF